MLANEILNNKCRRKKGLEYFRVYDDDDDDDDDDDVDVDDDDDDDDVEPMLSR